MYGMGPGNPAAGEGTPRLDPEPPEPGTPRFGSTGRPPESLPSIGKSAEEVGGCERSRDVRDLLRPAVRNISGQSGRHPAVE